MGEAVKITDLAKKMTSLAGFQLKDKYNPNGDIEIQYSGLRPGEKFYEELLIGDNIKGTQHPRIMQANEEFIQLDELAVLLHALQKVLSDNVVEEIKQLLTEIVSGYTPWKINKNNELDSVENKNIRYTEEKIVSIKR